MPLLVILFAFLLAASDSHSIELEWGEVATYAIEHNQDLAAARWQIAEAHARYLQSGRLSNPELEGSFAPTLGGKEWTGGVGFTQQFPLTSRLQLEKDVSQSEWAVAEKEIVDAERLLALNAETMAVRVWALAQEMELKEKQVANSDEMAKLALRLAQRGEASSLEAEQFNLEAQEISAEIMELSTAWNITVGKLKIVLGLDPTNPIQIKGQLPPPQTSPTNGMDLAARPDLQASEIQIETAEKRVELAKAQRFEDLSIGIFAEFERSEDVPEGLENDTLIGIRCALQLPIWNANEGNIKAAEATLSHSKHASNALALRIQAEVNEAQREMTAAAHQHDRILSDLLPAAAGLEDRFRSAYQRGEASLTDVLRAREKRLELEAREIKKLEQYHLARIRVKYAFAQSSE